MEPSLYGLLLEDVMGNKRDTSAGTTVFTEVLIFKGSLLQALITHNELMEPFTNPPHNYKTLANPAVTLYCERNQVNQLTFAQKDLLCGIQILSDRLEAIYKLNWVEKIEIGSSVYVFLPLASSPQKATVQYIGEVNGEIGRRFGLKLMRRRKEKVSGTIEGVEYFKCNPGYGIFVTMDMLTDESSKVHSKPKLPQKPIAAPSKSHFKKSKLVGSRVSFFDKHNRKLYGTVRWIGKSEVNGTEEILHGIEADYSVACEDIPQHIQGVKNECFKVSHASHTKLFFPASSLDFSEATEILSTASNCIDNIKHLPNGDREKVIQKAKQEMALDDWSSLDEFMLNSEKQKKPSSKAKILKHTTNNNSLDNHTAVLNDHDEVFPVKLIEIDNIIGSIDEPDRDQAHNHHFQHNRLNSTSSSIDLCSSPFDLDSSNIDDNEAISQLRHDLTIIQNQVTQLGADHGYQINNINDTIEQLQNDASTTEQKFQDQIDNLMGKTEDRIHQVALDIQKDYERLTTYHADLQKQLSLTLSQLSLTQQQLIGLQSMIVFSRSWVISHDQFIVGKEIGRGAWASVHKAMFRGTTVAAKCLHGVITTPKTREMFKQEMEMALHCQHQNIVTFLGATMEGAPVILMELMNVNLRIAYEQGQVINNQIHGILHDVAKALHFLHTRPDPVIHRDVSSANVLLKVLHNGEWLAKLGDLGTAKIQQQVASAGPGAIAYGAPEAGDYTKHSTKMDVYSFGVVVIETLTKTHPFLIVDTLKAQVHQQFPQYDQLVTSCTKQQSSNRPTMYDVLVQLDKIGAT